MGNHAQFRRRRTGTGIIAAPIVKGWCPDAWRPMLSGDGVLMRVQPPGGRLTQAQAVRIAELSTRYGNGLIDLTIRASLQIRGVAEADHATLFAELVDTALIDPATRQATPGIIVTPFWQSGDGTLELAQSLTDALNSFTGDLPGKFGFAIDSGQHPVLQQASADIRIERLSNGTLICRADGASRGIPVTSDSAANTALTLARWFLDSGGTRRMATHIANLPTQFCTHPAPISTADLKPGPTSSGTMVALPFGQIEAATLTRLAEIAPLRLTPWRMLLLEDTHQAPNLPGIITSPNDPLLRVIACIGAPGCDQALASTRALARTLAPQVPADSLLHVTGCAKGCAHPQAAPLTLVAQPKGFDLVHNGNAAAIPSLRDLTPAQLLANPAILHKAR
jgi:precorrin-3B synthase